MSSQKKASVGQDHYLNQYFRPNQKSNSYSSIVKQYQTFLQKQHGKRSDAKQSTSPYSTNQSVLKNYNTNQKYQHKPSASMSMSMEQDCLSETIKKNVSANQTVAKVSENSSKSPSENRHPLTKKSISPDEQISNKNTIKSFQQSIESGIKALGYTKGFIKVEAKDLNIRKQANGKVTIISSRSPSKDKSFQEQNNIFKGQGQIQNLFELNKNSTTQLLENSGSAMSLFQDSTKQLEELQQSNNFKQDKPELHKGIVDILSLIKKEKQVILNDMKHMLKQMNKYKKQYEDLNREYDGLRYENDQLKDRGTQDQSQKDQLNETYIKMIQLLNGMEVDYFEILPELDLGMQEQTVREQRIEKDEVIMVQKQDINGLYSFVDQIDHQKVGEEDRGFKKVELATVEQIEGITMKNNNIIYILMLVNYSSDSEEEQQIKKQDEQKDVLKRKPIDGGFNEPKQTKQIKYNNTTTTNNNDDVMIIKGKRVPKQFLKQNSQQQQQQQQQYQQQQSLLPPQIVRKSTNISIE